MVITNIIFINLIRPLKMIKSLMKKESVNKLTINRKYLPEIVSPVLLEISKKDGLPILRLFVANYYKRNGMLTKILGNVLKLKDISYIKSYHTELILKGNMLFNKHQYEDAAIKYEQAIEWSKKNKIKNKKSIELTYRSALNSWIIAGEI